jgi:type I restriction enzyme S subunit
LNEGQAREVPAVLPPIEEQRAIADFLDEKTAAIDDLIADKLRMIELLREERQVAIRTAVLRGVRSGVPVKDSGARWIGEVPAHWDVLHLRRVFRVINGGTPASSVEGYWSGDIAWLTPEDLGRLDGSVVRGTSRTLTLDGYQSCGATLVPAGSIVLSTRAPIGHVAIAGIPLCTNQGCRSRVSRGGDSSRYLYYLLLAAREELASRGQGSTFLELSAESLSAVLLCRPPLTEQHAIAEHIGRRTAQIDDVIAETHQALSLLREYRRSLISEAVTGKLPIREEAFA